MLRGDHVLNETKLCKHLGITELHMAKADFIQAELGVPIGYMGPVGMKPIRIIFDRDLALMPSIVTGANKADTHLTGVVPGRDFPLGEVAQLRSAGEEDGCPRCDGTLKMLKGIEVGHIFKLGNKYSHAMKALYLSEGGREEEMVMGCYGIGVTRIVAAAIEQNHDSHGIIWPASIAPYSVVVIPLGSEPETAQAAEAIYESFKAAGIEALIDDRSEAGPGVKFNDADLIGMPVQVVVGKVFKAEGLVEVKDRRTGTAIKVKPELVNAEVEKLLSKTEAIA